MPEWFIHALPIAFIVFVYAVLVCVAYKEADRTQRHHYKTMRNRKENQ